MVRNAVGLFLTRKTSTISQDPPIFKSKKIAQVRIPYGSRQYFGITDKKLFLGIDKNNTIDYNKDRNYPQNKVCL